MRIPVTPWGIRSYHLCMTFTPSSVIIVGGGLAGLATSVSLAARGYRVTILEARPRLGGRASSFTDPTTGQLLDACQHVSMGCCTNFRHLCGILGIEHFLADQPTLWFMTPDRRVSAFRADPWPAPFHLGRALTGAHYLTATDKLRVVYGMLRLLLESPTNDEPLLPWLERQRQTTHTISRFWAIVLTSALNESIENVGLKYARKVFVDGFIRHRDGFVVQVPTVPLGRFYGVELRRWLDRHGVIVRENTGVKQVSANRVVLREGEVLAAEHVVVAVPFDRVLNLLPSEVASDAFFARIAKLAPSPITSVHCWFDREVCERPHVVLVDCLGQWVFNRGVGEGGEQYLQVVVSAARAFRGLGREEVQQRIVAELQSLFPRAAAAKLVRAKVVTEHTATFSAVPGVDDDRPPQRTPIRGLVLAGDWTQTGWPATMEGAVRSGYLAAEAVLETDGRAESLVVPDLA
jgi:squalene-associated FAD-dependent desaturase